MLGVVGDLENPGNKMGRGVKSQCDRFGQFGQSGFKNNE